MIDFKKFEKLSKTEYGVLRNLVVEEGLIENSEIEQIIEQVTKDRFYLGKAKAEFARTLDMNESEACKVIITLCYYAMYPPLGGLGGVITLAEQRFFRRIEMMWTLMKKLQSRLVR